MLSQPVPLNTGRNKKTFVWFWFYGCVISNQPDLIVSNIVRKAQIVCTRHFLFSDKLKRLKLRFHQESQYLKYKAGVYKHQVYKCDHSIILHQHQSLVKCNLH